LTSPANANVNCPFGRTGTAERCADVDGLVDG
jgi:hypothetical protein